MQECLRKGPGIRTMMMMVMVMMMMMNVCVGFRGGGGEW